MRTVWTSILLAAVAGAVGCGSKAPKPVTDEMVREQVEQEKRVRDEESAHMKKQPKEKSRAQQVDDEERRHQAGGR
jgi:hypothetical protein